MKPRIRAIALPAPRRDEFLLMLIHAALTLLMPLLIFSLVGCEEKQDFAPVNYGPEVDPQKIADAISAPLQGVDPSSMQVGEFQHYETTQEIDTTSPRVFMDTGITVTALDKTVPERVLAKAYINEFKYDEFGQPTKTSFQDVPFCFEREAGGCEASPTNLDGPLTISEKTDRKVVAATVRAYYNGVRANAQNKTYHRFKTWTESIAPPGDVAQQPNCLGIPGCKIRVTWVQYEEVNWEKGKPEGITFEVAISPDVPYMSRIMGSCVSLLAPIGTTGQRVFYKECNKVRNFRFKQD